MLMPELCELDTALEEVVLYPPPPPWLNPPPPAAAARSAWLAAATVCLAITAGVIPFGMRTGGGPRDPNHRPFLQRPARRGSTHRSMAAC